MLLKGLPQSVQDAMKEVAESEEETLVISGKNQRQQ